MPWLRAGDNAATYPAVMRVAALADSDDRVLNEVFGWLVRCALQSAGHKEDYRIDAGTAQMLGGGRTTDLIRVATRVGLIRKVKSGGLIGYELVDDPEFLHMRLRAEIEWTTQRKRDNANPALTAPVRLRDGDDCRYCGVITWWGTSDRKSGRVGTYDHLVPGAAATIATMVVACRSCNSSRQDDPESLELRSVPAQPFYCASTAEFIRKHLDVEVLVSSTRPGSQPEHAPRTGMRPVIASLRPVTADNAPDTSTSARSADLSGSGSGFAGSGRDGPGQAGTGRYGPGGDGTGRGGGQVAGRRGRRGGGR